MGQILKEFFILTLLFFSWFLFLATTPGDSVLYKNNKVKIVKRPLSKDENKILEVLEVPYFSSFSVAIEAPKKKITIAIVDTGIDFSHPLLAPFAAPNQSFYDMYDSHGHGTHVAGILAQELNKIFGVQAHEIFEFRSFKYDPSSNQDSSTYLYALERAVNSHPKLLNISSSSWGEIPLEKLLLDQAALLYKTVVVVAAGNNSSERNEYFPCGYDYVICVGNISSNGDLVPSSNHGEKVKVYGLGDNILSSLPGGKFGFMTGTSQATPLVTAALVASMVNPRTGPVFDQKISLPSTKERGPASQRKVLK